MRTVLVRAFQVAGGLALAITVGIFRRSNVLAVTFAMVFAAGIVYRNIIQSRRNGSA